mgnify:CR=1 FL=1
MRPARAGHGAPVKPGLVRRLLAAASEIAQVALEENAEINEVIDHAESTLFGVTERRLRKELIPIRQAASDYYDHIEYLHKHQDESLGLPTGFTDLEEAKRVTDRLRAGAFPDAYIIQNEQGKMSRYRY